MVERVLRDHSKPCEHRSLIDEGNPGDIYESYRQEGLWSCLNAGCPGGREVTIDIEKVAAVEHDQWAHWTAYMFANLERENVARWRQQIDTPYAELTEAEKDSDREWANKAVDAVLGGFDG